LLRRLSPPKEKTEFVQGIAFSPDSQFLAVITNEATTLWRVSDGMLSRTLARGSYSSQEHHSAGGFTVAFSPDGQVLFADGRGIKQWHVSDGRLLRILEPNRDIDHLVISPNGETLAIGRSDSVGIDLLRVNDGSSECSLSSQGMIGALESSSFNSDGSVLVSSNLGGRYKSDDKVRLWRVAECRLIQTISKTSQDSYYHLAFSPDGELLALGATQMTGKTTYGIIKLFRLNDSQFKH
jgi:WD40 repeat protein